MRPKLLSEGFTNDDGLVTWNFNALHVDRNIVDEIRILVLEEQNGQIYFQKVEHNSFQYKKIIEVRQFQDKKLVPPGDSLKIRGYIRDVQGQKLPTNLTAKNFSVGIYPDFVEEREKYFDQEGQQEFDVLYDEEFGSFFVDVPVPTNAKQQHYHLQVSSSSSREYIDRSFYDFFVGDPRPTNANLNVQVPDKISATEKLLIDIDATTWGQQSSINIAYGKFVERYKVFPTEQIDTNTITTDTDGKARYQINMTPELTASNKYGTKPDSIYIDFEWIAPTDEYITLRKIVPIQENEVLVDFKFRTSMQTDVPGIEFRFLLDGGIGDVGNVLIYVMEYSEREIQLYGEPYTNWRQFVFESSRYGLKEEHVLFDAEQLQCSGREGCTYTFPHIGKFLMAACVSKDGKQICRGMFGGKNKTEWQQEQVQEQNLIGHAQPIDGV
eukprot:TRINITY_DN17335_c0_g3_i1.p1 TRINITY_DN17335_c0_g3~~TRINITY_DN17335_c0_g3_i1.p1  ORF type:complete len:507 (-),score=60.85 TRINITY_DN17335_c0_g3_i1:53-1369(-)